MRHAGRPKIKKLDELEGRDELFKEVEKFINRNIGKKRTFSLLLTYEGKEGEFHAFAKSNLSPKSPLSAWKGILSLIGNYFSKLYGEYDLNQQSGRMESEIPQAGGSGGGKGV